MRAPTRGVLHGVCLRRVI